MLNKEVEFNRINNLIEIKIKEFNDALNNCSSENLNENAKDREIEKLKLKINELNIKCIEDKENLETE